MHGHGNINEENKKAIDPGWLFAVRYVLLLICYRTASVLSSSPKVNRLRLDLGKMKLVPSSRPAAKS
jgi:hypothetical protein